MQRAIAAIALVVAHGVLASLSLAQSTTMPEGGAPQIDAVGTVAGYETAPPPTMPASRDESGSYIAAFERDFPARRDLLPAPARIGRRWRWVVSGSSVILASAGFNPYGVLTTGFSLATSGTMPGRTAPAAFGFDVMAYVLTPHEQTRRVAYSCDGESGFRDVTDRRGAYGGIAHFLFGTRYIQSTVGIGMLYVASSHPGCLDAPRVGDEFWALAATLGLSVGIDPGNVVMLRAELLAYFGLASADDVRTPSLSLGVEVHL